MTTLAITTADADLIFREARTVQEWNSTPVTDDELRSAWDLAKFGPTAMNCQPLRVFALRTPEAKARLVPHMMAGNQLKVSAAPVSLLLAYDPHFSKYMELNYPQAPGIGAQLEANPQTRDDWGRSDGFLQAAYLILALRAVGLGAHPMNGADFAGADAEFFQENGYRSFLVINVGHFDGTGTSYPRNNRMTFDQIFTEL